MMKALLSKSSWCSIGFTASPLRKRSLACSNMPNFSGDKLVGEVSRLVVAEACIQLLDIEFAEGEIYEINSVEVIVHPSPL